MCISLEGLTCNTVLCICVRSCDQSNKAQYGLWYKKLLTYERPTDEIALDIVRHEGNKYEKGMQIDIFKMTSLINKAEMPLYNKGNQ